MTRPFHPVPYRVPTPHSRPWTARIDQRPQLRNLRSRRYEIAWLGSDGSIETATRVAPALAPFEAAVSAMRQGTLLKTLEGPRAVEDLLPGDMVETEEGRFEPLVWVGSMTVFTKAGDEEAAAPLTRITADSFGIGRPMPDLVLGQGARILQRKSGCREMFGAEAALAPASAFEDGSQVVGLRPQSPVKVYHVAFAEHRVIRANGVEIESYNPGNFAEMRMARDLLSYYLTLFPHIRSLDQFGPAIYPQLSAEDAAVLTAA